MQPPQSSPVHFTWWQLLAWHQIPRSGITITCQGRVGFYPDCNTVYTGAKAGQHGGTNMASVMQEARWNTMLGDFGIGKLGLALRSSGLRFRRTAGCRQ